MTTREMKALEWAVLLHKDQVDKQGKPYILHVLRVAIDTSSVYNSEDLFIAALLHDVVEDCDVTVNNIRENFGDKVASIVDSLSRRKNESYNKYILRLCKNPLAMQIKELDLEDNLLEVRLEALPVREQRKLRKKYNKALETIGKLFCTPYSRLW